MATYYIRKTGNNSNAGTSAGAAWLTINKALTAGSGVVGGDTIYIGAGTYREVLTVGISPGSTVNVIGDVDGSQTGDAGEVVWTAFITNDSSVPSTLSLIALNGNSNFAFSYLVFVGGSVSTGNIINAANAGSQNISFTRCGFLQTTLFGTGSAIYYQGSANAAANWTFDTCTIFASGGATFETDMFVITTPTSASGADWDLNFVVKNCLMISGSAGLIFAINTTLSNAFKPGGVVVQGCTIGSFNSTMMRTLTANISTSITCRINNCFVMGGTLNQITANTLGQIVEDYNYFMGSAIRSNVNVGTHSKDPGNNVNPVLFDIGHSWIMGFKPRPPFTPMANSVLLGVGASASLPAPLTVDALNRPRSLSVTNTNSAGWLERHDTGTKSIAADADGGLGAALLLTGYSDQDILIPVSATLTTIAIKQKTSGYAAGNGSPEIELLAAPEIGVTGQIVADISAHTSYTTLTLASFTPTGNGWVTLRLKNKTANTTGQVWYDTLLVS